MAVVTIRVVTITAVVTAATRAVVAAITMAMAAITVVTTGATTAAKAAITPVTVAATIRVVRATTLAPLIRAASIPAPGMAGVTTMATKAARRPPRRR
jgi:hypothetical protein